MHVQSLHAKIDEIVGSVKLLLSSNKKKIIFVGVSDLTDIAVLVSKIHNIKISFIYDINFAPKSYCGIKIKKNLRKYSKVIGKKKKQYQANWILQMKLQLIIVLLNEAN